MKCKYCGGDVTLQDHFCPHCGRPVDQALRHQKEMREYETEFEETKREAIDKISVSSGGGTSVGIRLAIIVALTIALIWMLINLNSYDINQRKEKKLANANYDAYVEQIEQYIADRDFVALSRFEDKHNLDWNDKYKEYRDIFYAASSYEYIYRGILETAFLLKDARNLYYAENLSENVNRFYEQILSDRSAYSDADPEKTEAAYNEMEQDMLALLQNYLHISKEDADSMRELSKSRRKVLIEQALDARIVGITGVGLSEMKAAELPELLPAQEVEK
ncbi:MAG: hypothetical protein K6G34_13715 [Lachnospiraceae bacterium]|nr:hypothetical protein [Lachnospiraceae bacterium]